MKRKAAVTAELLERVPRTLILSELINNIPADLSLLEFKIETKIIRKKLSCVTTALDVAKKKRKSKLDDAKVEPVKGSEVNLKLVGVAPTDVEVAKFIHALGNSPLFYVKKNPFTMPALAPADDGAQTIEMADKR